jgi:hypothetical protein
LSDSFLRLLNNKGFKEESMTKVGWYAIGKSTTLESNKSHLRILLANPEVPKFVYPTCLLGRQKRLGN